MIRKVSWAIFLSCLVYSTSLYAQTKPGCRAWSYGRKLEFSDFHSDSSKMGESDMNFIRAQKLHSMFACGVTGFIDRPKNWKKRAKKGENYLEDVHFVGKMCPEKCYMSKPDSFELKVWQLSFDLQELAARVARKKMHFWDSAMGNSFGTRSIHYLTIVEECHQLGIDLFHSAVRDIFVQRRPGAYEELRSYVDGQLAILKEYSTSDEDCRRFESEKPLIEGYVPQTNLIRL